MRSVFFLAFLSVLAYGIALAAGIVMLQMLARPWRRSVGQHWTERARQAYAPGMAVLLLAIFLSIFVGTAGGMLMESLAGMRWAVGSAVLGAAAFAGGLTVRYIWLRELWGSRVTIRSWIAGCLLLMLGFIPGFLVVVALLLFMPEHLDATAVYTFSGGVLAVTFFALGGGLVLLRLLGIARPAPSALSGMVGDLARKMNARCAVKVFILEWAHVNALAWPRFRAIGFSKALLDVMAEDEVRAVAAHELAHLLEPKWVMWIRTAYMFAYLPLVPLIKYGGLWAIPLALIAFVAIAFAYIRFTHRYEVRADRLEREALGDSTSYATSLIKLHQANFAPAVMPGRQTHPHLYDRLLAAGIQPDFPRPAAPSKHKPMLAVAATGFVVVMVIFAMTVAIGVAFKLSGYELVVRNDGETAEGQR